MRSIRRKSAYAFVPMNDPFDEHDAQDRGWRLKDIRMRLLPDRDGRFIEMLPLLVFYVSYLVVNTPLLIPG